MNKLLLFLSLVAASVAQGQEIVAQGRTIYFDIGDVRCDIVKNEQDERIHRVTVGRQESCSSSALENDTYRQQLVYYVPFSSLTENNWIGLGSSQIEGRDMVVSILGSLNGEGERIFPVSLYLDIFSKRRQRVEPHSFEDVAKIAKQQVGFPYDLKGGARIVLLFDFYKKMTGVADSEDLFFRCEFSPSSAYELMAMESSRINDLVLPQKVTNLRSLLLQARVVGSRLTVRELMVAFRCAHRGITNLNSTIEGKNDYIRGIIKVFSDLGIAEEDLPKGPNEESYNPITVDFPRGEDSDTEND